MTLSEYIANLRKEADDLEGDTFVSMREGVRNEIFAARLRVMAIELENLDYNVVTPCECPSDKREYHDYYICHTSRVNIYKCKVCGKTH